MSRKKGFTVNTTYKPHSQISCTPSLEAQILEKKKFEKSSQSRLDKKKKSFASMNIIKAKAVVYTDCSKFVLIVHINCSKS